MKLIQDTSIKDFGNKIASTKISLQDIVDSKDSIQLSVPLYQRLYVWDQLDIKLFIEDISKAFLNKEDNYFIGNVMFSNTSTRGKLTIDLIDGQQRFTTLWLLSIILKKYSKKLEDFVLLNGEPRLSFTSREKTNRFFKKEIKNINIDLFSKEEEDLSSEEIEVAPLIDGFNNIKNILNEEKEKEKWNNKKLKEFAEYINSNVILVQTTVPKNLDLNQIFESLNSGGKQLENHQILKSRFLRVLRDLKIEEEKIKELIYKWDACSNMNTYLGRSIYLLTKKKWEEVINSNAKNLHYNSNKVDAYFNLGEYILERNEKADLLEILKKNSDQTSTEFTSSDRMDSNKEVAKATSIISFPQFLMHTLRVFHLINSEETENMVPVDSKNLLKYFPTNDNGIFAEAENIESFINLLFSLRFLFDKYVIKWTSFEDDNQQRLLINKQYIAQPEEGVPSIYWEYVESNTQLVQLQRLLYIIQSSQTQYWLTPFLYHLYKGEMLTENYEMDIATATKQLEYIDNVIYCISDSEKKIGLAELSVKLCANQQNYKNGDYEYVKEKLSRFDGTNFLRYWFYKTEYLLWVNRDEYTFLDEKERELWTNFTMTFKNSIEHIYPQSANKPFGTDAQKGEFLNHPEKERLRDYFGNLTLLTVSQNSAYSNASVHDKKIKHSNKIKEESIDNLKSSLIFNLVDCNNENEGWEEGQWNFSKAKYHHEKQILPLFKRHFEKKS